MPATLLLLLPALLIAGIAVVVAFQAWNAQRRAWTARGWLETSGRVISAGIRAEQVRQPTSIGERYRMVTRYAPHVVYRYTARNAVYQSERMTLGTRLLHSDAEDAARIAARYPIGSAVTVYYNPADPAEATLDRHTSGGTIVLWLVALGLLAIAGMVAALAFT